MPWEATKGSVGISHHHGVREQSTWWKPMINQECDGQRRHTLPGNRIFVPFGGVNGISMLAGAVRCAPYVTSSPLPMVD